jgi:transposase
LNSASISLVPSLPRNADASRFSLWRIPGRKHLFQQGEDLQLWSCATPSIAQWWLAPGLADSDPFAYALAADQQLGARLITVREMSTPYESKRPIHSARAKSRPSRTDVLHVRALQAFDGTVCAASRGKLIKDRFEVEFAQSSVWRLLGDLGWSVQRPTGQARQRDEQAILTWKNKRWPALKKSQRDKGE